MTACVVWCLAMALAPRPGDGRLPPGLVAGSGTLLTDPAAGRFGTWAMLEAELPNPVVLLADLPEEAGLFRGARITFEGDIEEGAGVRRGVAYLARLDVAKITSIGGSPAWHIKYGEMVRDRVRSRLEPHEGGRALLAGFLIGDTSGLEESDVEAMRRSGLSHFVAVSGSNVALFLALLFVVAGPLGMGPKRRALIGIAGLPVYAAATGFEPSVMRASVMAGLLLGGRLIGVVLEAWQLLSLAVILLVSFNPLLAMDVGFQLSVAATAGVLVGARWPARSRIGRALLVTGGAQLAVAPLILVHFGTIPLLSPVANLVAAPLVGAATLIGAIGVLAVGPLIPVATLLAELVMWLSRGAAVWPQVGLAGFLLTLAGLAAAAVSERRRAALAVIAAGAISLTLLTPAHSPPVGAVVLDVGQGDAILLHGGDGRFALIDGGPDPTILLDKLRAYGVGSLELVVATHVHADHIGGLVGLFGSIPVERMWMALEPHSTSLSGSLVEGLDAWGISTMAPDVGETTQLGSLRVTVEGPLRRYASPNDQSMVLTIDGNSRSMLLAGDIETHAQAELGHLRAEVLKVPHQGAATSDAGWLVEVGAELAIISVGANNFGHPAAWVVDVLEESGANVVRTDQAGDVPVALS